MSRILCIFPNDSTTMFLNEIVGTLEKAFSGILTCIRIEPTIDAHNECLTLISNEPDDSLILFLGHGQSDKLFGASSEGQSDEYKVFKEKGFIHGDNISVFANKKVISLSCNSNETIGKDAITQKCTSFIGFGNIPTDWIIEIDEYSQIKSKDIDYFNEILCIIVANSIIYSIQHGFTFAQFEKLFKIIVNKEIIEKLHHVYAENAWWIDRSLYNLKDEITIFGNHNCKLIG